MLETSTSCLGFCLVSIVALLIWYNAGHRVELVPCATLKGVSTLSLLLGAFLVGNKFHDCVLLIIEPYYISA